MSSGGAFVIRTLTKFLGALKRAYQRHVAPGERFHCMGVRCKCGESMVRIASDRKYDWFWECPDCGRRQTESRRGGEPKRLAHTSDDWRCGTCGHDKWLPPDEPIEKLLAAPKRKCARCGTCHARNAGHLPDSDKYGDWRPADDTPPRLTGQVL